MFIELHLLQNFAPSCLNRDDTNTPKDCTFGGFRRARISSQCIKRSNRKYFEEAKLLSTDHLAERSKRLLGAIAEQLAERGKPAETALGLAKAAFAAVKLATDEKKKDETQYLLFLGRGEIQALADVIEKHWDELSDSLTPAQSVAAAEEGAKAPKKTAKQKKKEASAIVPAEVAKKVKAALDGGKAADVALFGRMLADQADLNVHAACQVAHALSTNKVGSMEMDFYTAVDDLKEREADPGAGMMGTVEFNSSCFYRYANVDFDQLRQNLQNDVQLARATVKAFLEASIHAIPTGKQNSMAAHNKPSLILAVVRERGLMSLANAFESPIRPSEFGSLVANSILALDSYWGQLERMYGSGASLVKLCVEQDKLELEHLGAAKAPTVENVIEAVMAKLPAGKGAA
jgi:CRISPR system Cascade subunit CasC